MADKLIVLRHATMLGLQYGPDPTTAIQFGPRGGFEPHFAIVDETHPLLNRLLEEDPDVEIYTGPSESKVFIFVCPLHPDREFRTRTAYMTHLTTKGHQALLEKQLEVDTEEAEVAAALNEGASAEEPEAVGVG